ncbi:hypothetical protein ACJMK2_044192 [Sinanodonta woodiana]|uniref:Chromo domain-containing protein n=1 Tax=Sinanodonta woodiana TaxID=1069815 RepID=A0ABD3VZ89_SINWO
MTSLVRANSLEHFKIPEIVNLRHRMQSIQSFTRLWHHMIKRAMITHQPTNSAEWYSVDKLLQSKCISGKKHYLVKWTDGSEPSWQPAKDVSLAFKKASHRTRTQSNTRRKRLGQIFRL